MKVDGNGKERIARLLNALDSSAQRAATPHKTELNPSEVNAETVGAVRVASDFGVKGQDSDRQARIAELKAQVEEGTYNPPVQKVAEAVATELFAA